MENNYYLDVFEGEEGDTWEADDWCYLVKQDSEIIAICATQEEADYLVSLLNKYPIPH